MTRAFQTLLQAILEDDPARAAETLAAHPGLASQAITEAWLEPRFTHWIYAGDTALHVAAAGCRTEIAAMLLEHGANPGAAGNHRHSQPLHYAADGCEGGLGWNPARQVAMIRLLLQSGANLHARDKNGATPLHRAVRTRSAAAVECLLEAGADPAAQNKPGSTPFHLAVRNTGRGDSGSLQAKTAQQQIIQAFLKRGVSPDVPDRAGKSVRAWAEGSALRELPAGVKPIA